MSERVKKVGGHVPTFFWLKFGGRVHEAMIETAVVPVLESMGLQLWSCAFLGASGGRPTLQIMIERLDGIPISAEDCEAASRELSVFLDVHHFLKQAYILEISSPGLDRRLSKPWHFERCVGSEVELKLLVPRADQKNFRGKLMSASSEDGVSLEIEGEPIFFKFEEIAKAKCLPSIHFKKRKDD